MDDEILRKPGDKEDARRMISLLSGKVHQVYTGVTLVWQENADTRYASFYEMTEVELYPMNEEEILAQKDRNFGCPADEELVILDDTNLF